MIATYRQVAFTEEEVVLLLNIYVQQKLPILLWQAHAKQHAKHGIVTDFQVVKKCMKVTFSERIASLDIKQPVYCKGDERKMVFKSFSIGSDHNSVKIGTPSDVRLEELRTVKRFDLSSNKNAFMTVSILSHYESKESSFVFKLQDIAENGCGLMMHSSNVKFFKEGDSVKVTHIGSDVVHIPFMAQVMHIQPVTKKGQAEVQLYKVGLKFEQSLFFYSYYLTRHLDY